MTDARSGRHPIGTLAGFKSEWVAGFLLECVAGCVGIRSLNPWGMNRDDLQQLSKDQLIDLVLQLHRPDKTSRTSSKPPSTHRKERRENARPGGAKPGHKPHNRRMASDPDAVVDHRPTVCKQFGGSVEAEADRMVIGEYDEIEIPPITPHVVRHRRFSCRCGQCGLEAKAAAPAVATSTPFGLSIGVQNWV